MSFTPAEAMSVIERYAPILLLHREEKFVPVRADRFLEGCALWCNSPPTHTQESWGDCEPVEDDGDVPFPHHPQIPKGGLSLDPDDDSEGVGGKWFLGHVNDDMTRPYTVSNSQVEHFLEHSGWVELGTHGDFQPAEPVDAMTVNSIAAVEIAAERWRSEPELQGAKRWYYAEAFCFAGQMAPALPAVFGAGFVNAMLNRFPSGFWMAVYYYLFPMHEEPMAECESWAETNHPSIEAQLHGPPGRGGNYEGDWQAVAVITPAPGTLTAPVSPLALQPNQFPEPAWVAVGQRARGLIEVILADKFEFVDRQLFRVFDVVEGEVGLIDRHPKIFVARNSHNFYTEGGRQGTPGFRVVDAKSVCDRYEQGLQVEQDIRQDVEQAKATAITVVKILGGLLAGGIIGAIAGGIAALVEASNRPDPPDPITTADDPGDFPPSAKKIGIALVPLGHFEATAELADKAERIQAWAGLAAQHLIDPSDLWWPSWMGNPTGYQGRWGVTCTHDPFSRRTGIPFPHFREALAKELLVELSK